MATDKRHEIIEQLYEKAHRFLHEDEVIDATVNANLSIIDANYIINSLLEKGVYISEDIRKALSEQKREAKTASHRTIGERKSPEDPTTFKMLDIPIGSNIIFAPWLYKYIKNKNSLVLIFNFHIILYK